MVAASKAEMLARIGELSGRLTLWNRLLAVGIGRKALKKTSTTTGYRRRVVRQALLDGDVTVRGVLEMNVVIAAEESGFEIDPETLAMIIELILTLLMMFML